MQEVWGTAEGCTGGTAKGRIGHSRRQHRGHSRRQNRAQQKAEQGTAESRMEARTSMKGLVVSREASVVPVIGRLNLLPSSSRNTTLAVKLVGRLPVKLTITGSFSLAMPIKLPSGKSKVRGRCCSSGGGRICMQKHTRNICQLPAVQQVHTGSFVHARHAVTSLTQTLHAATASIE